MKTAELDGVLLDYWTARADGHERVKILNAGERLNGVRVEQDTCAATTPGFSDWWQPYHADTWHNAGPLMQREKIGVTFGALGGEWHALVLKDGVLGIRHTTTGPTPTIAAMRAFVASRFGDTVPDEPRAG